MQTRKDRLDLLRLILTNHEISRQDELLKELAHHGCILTQATLSRDLRSLKAAKVAGPHGYVYVLPENPLYRRPVSTAVLTEYYQNSAFISIAFTGQLASSRRVRAMLESGFRHRYARVPLSGRQYCR